MFWDDASESFLELFLGFIRIFFNKTATSQRGSALEAYPVHSFLLHFSNSDKRWLVQSGHSLVAYLSLEFVL